MSSPSVVGVPGERSALSNALAVGSEGWFRLQLRFPVALLVCACGLLAGAAGSAWAATPSPGRTARAMVTIDTMELVSDQPVARGSSIQRAWSRFDIAVRGWVATKPGLLRWPADIELGLSERRWARLVAEEVPDTSLCIRTKVAAHKYIIEGGVNAFPPALRRAAWYDAIVGNIGRLAGTRSAIPNAHMAQSIARRTLDFPPPLGP